VSDPDFSFTWYGHACTDIESPSGKHVLLDPWFRNPKSSKAPDEVDACDVMLVSHGHFDHLGGPIGDMASSDAVTIATRLAPDWPCIHELSLWLGAVLPEGAAGKVIGMNAGGTVEVAGLRVSMVRAIHSAGDWVASGSVPLYLGEPVGFILELEDGVRLYLSGDTAVFGDMQIIREMYAPKVAFLPIGGHYTMDPVAAALAVSYLGVETVVPLHYGTFPILAGTPEALRQALAARGLGTVEVVAPAVGERVRVRGGMVPE
jgi:L-ascorbate metabolism protein UlaG (beta-lactamase superfamily)